MMYLYKPETILITKKVIKEQFISLQKNLIGYIG